MKQLRWFFTVLSSLGLFFLISNPVYAEQANRFYSEITINSDASITVRETIDFTTSTEKHGIYRYIPNRYNRDGNLYQTSIDQISVTDSDGITIPFSISQKGDNKVLKIGDPNQTFNGNKTYIINYRTTYAVQHFSDHDELYWDITGEGWQFPILKTLAIINSPHTEITKITCYSGKNNSSDGLCQGSFTATQAQFNYDQTVNYGDNVTIVVGLAQNGAITFPPPQPVQPYTSPDASFWDTYKPSPFVQWVAPFLILIPTVLLWLLWYYKGRDLIFLSPNVFDTDPRKPQKLKPLFFHERIPFVYEPIKALTPGEAGTLLDEKTDNQDLIAEIIDLARKKYLKLERTTEKGFLGIGSHEEYIFTKLKADDGRLPAHQQYLFSKLFDSGDSVKLSDLKGEFYTHMQHIRDQINTGITRQKLFTDNPNSVRAIYMILAVIITVVCWVFVAPFLSLISASPVPYLLILLVTIPNIILAYNMPQKTAVGHNYMLQAKGLKQMITYGKWREEIKEKNLFIEEVLPFAIALGVVDKLAKDMEGLNIKPPEYIQNAMVSNMAMGSFINSFSNQAISNLSYNPSSSRMSGGSGFSGGSSGGGGGGGGGGSW